VVPVVVEPLVVQLLPAVPPLRPRRKRRKRRRRFIAPYLRQCSRGNLLMNSIGVRGGHGFRSLRLNEANIKIK